MISIRSHRGLATAGITGLIAAATVSFTLFAATNPSKTVTVACTTSVGSDITQDVSFSVSGPNSVQSGSSVTMTIDPVETTLPSSASGVTINSYEDVRTMVVASGVTVTSAAITTQGTYPATVSVDGNAVTVHVEGPIPGGSTVTSARVSIEATVTAAIGESIFLDAGNPFYQIIANTSFGAVTATCNPADATQAANARLTIPVAAPDTAPPSISIIAPFDGAIYGFQQEVSAAYTCSDPGGIATCTGTVANGAAIDTSTEGPKTFTVDATDNAGNAASKTVDYLVLAEGAPPPAAPAYTALNPGRLLDTRDSFDTVDGQFKGGGKLSGQVIELQVAGRHGVPENAVTAVLNLTATETDGPGFATMYPCDAERPLTSNLNYTLAGDTRANSVITRLDDSGKACLYNFGATSHFVVDVGGYFPAGASYAPVNPGRLLDTRPGAETIDGQGSDAGPSTSGTSIEVQVADRNGVPPNAVAAVVNVTAVDTAGPGFVTAYPCGGDVPTASNVNFSGPGQVTPNAVVSGLGTDGKICLYSFGGSSQLIVDLMGYFPEGTDYTTLTPGRLADTRADEQTIDGQSAGVGRRSIGSPLVVTVAGRHGIPADARAAVLSVTATNTDGPGFVTIWPCDDTKPIASNVNYAAAGQTRPNLAISKLSADGTVCVETDVSPSDIIVDVTGYFPVAEGPVVPPVDPPPTTTTTTTLPGATTTTTVPGSTTTTVPDPGGEDAGPACALYADQAAAQTAYDGYIDAYNDLDPLLQPVFGPTLLALANGLDANGNGTACEDYPYP
ncbi:MAG TPA: hypothetical protein VMM60_17010 [Ilumatobacter sp.]|nr:hypothetical protein [Ilumatobacter sp.]